MKSVSENIPTITRNQRLHSANCPLWKGFTSNPIFASIGWTVLMILFMSPLCVKGEKVMGVENDEFDFDGLPGVQHDFKVFVHAGMEECFYQKIVQGAQLHARFEVLKGGNKEVDFYIRETSGDVIKSATANEGFLSVDNATQGVYAICIDNVFDRYGYKVVYVYLVSIVMQEWIQYQAEIQHVNLLAANFSESLSGVELSIVQMKRSQSGARFSVVRDWYMASSNLYYVGMWSMMQCALIIIAAIIQVYALRRLFRTTATTPTAKPRA